MEHLLCENKFNLFQSVYYGLNSSQLIFKYTFILNYSNLNAY